jgi:uncharacterized protein YkwD
MRPHQARKFQPTLDALDGRRLLSGGVSASLAHATLSVEGTSADAPIQVQILAPALRPRVPGSVVVEGVGTFPAFLVRRISIEGVLGEAVAVVGPQRGPQIPVTVSGVGPGPEPAPSAPVTLSSPTFGTMSALEQEVVDLTNAARAASGLAPLQVNSALVTAAQTHSRDMAQLNVMDHTLPGVAESTLQSRATAAGYNYAWLGENIAFNYLDDPSVVGAWMNSPAHRANILSPNYTDIGVGIAWNRLGQPYYTEEFGSQA